jgi:hypothetical protein
MQTGAWNFAPADAKRLPDLMKSFGCADVVAPVDADEFGKRTGELISRNKGKTVTRKKGNAVTPAAGKYRLRSLQCQEVAAQTRDPYAKDMLTELAEEFMQAARQAEKLVSRAA